MPTIVSPQVSNPARSGPARLPRPNPQSATSCRSSYGIRNRRYPMSYATDSIPVPGFGDVPIVPSINTWGGFTELSGLIEPEQCDHRLSSWSSNLALRCPRCGAPMFLSARLLAGIPGDVLEDMYAAWSAAGCPPWSGDGWRTDPAHWTLIVYPLFPIIGLPVRNDRLPAFQSAVQEVPCSV